MPGEGQAHLTRIGPARIVGQPFDAVRRVRQPDVDPTATFGQEDSRAHVDPRPLEPLHHAVVGDADRDRLVVLVDHRETGAGWQAVRRVLIHWQAAEGLVDRAQVLETGVGDQPGVPLEVDEGAELHPVLLAVRAEDSGRDVLVGVRIQFVPDGRPLGVARDAKAGQRAVVVGRLDAVDGHLFAAPRPDDDRGVRRAGKGRQHYVLGVVAATDS